MVELGEGFVAGVDYWLLLHMSWNCKAETHIVGIEGCLNALVDGVVR